RPRKTNTISLASRRYVKRNSTLRCRLRRRVNELICIVKFIARADETTTLRVEPAAFTRTDRRNRAAGEWRLLRGAAPPGAARRRGAGVAAWARSVAMVCEGAPPNHRPWRAR